MTYFALVLFTIACAVQGSSSRSCLTDADCRRDECCALSFTGESMECREMGERVGDACGGPYLCPNCYRNLTCTFVSSSVEGHLSPSQTQAEGPLHTATVELGSSCPHPASSTCQNITSTPLVMDNVVNATEGFKTQFIVEERGFPRQEEL